jgi:hypothetical protein
MVPLLLPLDLIPHGLKKAVGPKVVTVGGRDVLRHMLREFPAAVERAAEEAKRASHSPGEPPDVTPDGASDAIGEQPAAP